MPLLHRHCNTMLTLSLLHWCDCSSFSFHLLLCPCIQPPRLDGPTYCCSPALGISAWYAATASPLPERRNIALQLLSPSNAATRERRQLQVEKEEEKYLYLFSAIIVLAALSLVLDIDIALDNQPQQWNRRFGASKAVAV